MDIIDMPQNTVPQGPIQPHSQPVAALENLDPVMDDAAVRQAIVSAEAQGIDPLSLKIEDMAQVQAPAPAPQMDHLRVEVPQKFLRPDGVADVEKIQASTKQLDEAIQNKEQKINKTVDDYMAEYRAKETKFKNLPNPARLAAELPQQQPPIQTPDVSGMTTRELEEIIRRDYQQDPVMTTTRLIELAVQKHFEPLRAEKQEDTIRKNIDAIAAKDSRVLDPQVFAAINVKLKENPKLWGLDNPHQIAWLQVKEEMRLGEPTQAQAQPSRPLSPVLGGGTPPSAPSASAQPQNIFSSLEKLDLRDRKQEAAGDEAIRALLGGRR